MLPRRRGVGTTPHTSLTINLTRCVTNHLPPLVPQFPAKCTDYKMVCRATNSCRAHLSLAYSRQKCLTSAWATHNQAMCERFPPPEPTAPPSARRKRFVAALMASYGTALRENRDRELHAITLMDTNDAMEEHVKEISRDTVAREEVSRRATGNGGAASPKGSILHRSRSCSPGHG